MKAFFHSSILSVLCMLISIACSKEELAEPVHPVVGQPFNQNHSKGPVLQAILDEYTAKGLTGIVVAIKDEEGSWEGVSGFSKIETGEMMVPGLVHANGSVTKVYTSAAVLSLYEEGQIELDKAIHHYLPAALASKIKGSDEITVRMLLSHTSGIADYATLAYQMEWFNDLTRTLSWEDALSTIFNKPLLFAPGSSYAYSNSNYMLLSLLVAHITGSPDGEFLRDRVLEPHGLNHTYYKVQPEYLEQLPMPNYYLDRYDDGRVQNVTKGLKAELYTELGDGGLVASALDYVTFMHALSNGQIISPENYTLMKTPVMRDYGLGLGSYHYGKKAQYGHNGALLGVGSLLLHLEASNTSVFIAINTDFNLVGGSKAALYYEMRDKIGNYLASF